jgi:hypothetical protein
MRATFITTALENGATLDDLQRAAGHAEPGTTKLYDRPAIIRRSRRASSRRDTALPGNDRHTALLARMPDRDKAIQSKVEQLTRLWGDETWIDAAYDTTSNLFGDPEKVSNERFEAAWRERLKKKAGFKFVSKPMPMKTKTNSVIYYLYFASQKPVAAGIVDDIFKKYGGR